MKTDNKTLMDLSIEIKVAIKQFMKRKGNDPKLWSIISAYNKEYIKYLLSQFDRYGNDIGYEKTGLRVVDYKNGVIRGFKIGYRSDTYKGTSDPVTDRLNKTHFNELKPVKLNDSIITLPSTEYLIDVFRVVISGTIFSNKSFDEIVLYCKCKKLKPLMNKISENGIKLDYAEELNEIFEGLNVRNINNILSLFDTKYPYSKFKGIRLVNGQYQSVNDAERICAFRFNRLNMRQTVDILKVWKSIEG